MLQKSHSNLEIFDLKMKRIYFNLLNGFPKIFLKTITNRR